MTTLIAGYIELGAWPKLSQSLEYILVDYVIAAMMHIASSNKNLGHSYSLLPSNPQDSIAAEGICRVIDEVEYITRMIDHADWARAVVEKQREDAPLASLMPVEQEQARRKSTRWDAIQFTPGTDRITRLRP